MNFKLNKNILKSIAIYAIVFIIYNILMFAIPFKHDGTFKGAYAFGLIAIAAQVLVEFLSFSGANTLRKKVYAFPIVQMGVFYLIAQLILSLIFILISTFTENFPGWIVSVISVVLLGIFTILVLLTDTTRDNIEQIEDEETRNTVKLKTLRNSIDSISRRVDDKELLPVLKKLNSIAKYSDPVSSEELFEIESLITEKISELECFVNCRDFVSAKTLAEEIINLFEDRNAQCKIFKRK